MRFNRQKREIGSLKKTTEVEKPMTLNDAANYASVITPIVGLSAWGWYEFGRWCKRRKLEQYLKGEKETETGGDHGQRTILHVMTYVGLTESEVLQASFNSKHVIRRLKADAKGYADK